jgi:hypothetical protein
MAKQRVAPAMALVHERSAPYFHPKRDALEKVIKKAGNGAIRDWKSIRPKETIGAQIPKLRMYPLIVSTSYMPKRKKTCSRFFLTGSTKIQIDARAIRGGSVLSVLIIEETVAWKIRVEYRILLPSEPLRQLMYPVIFDKSNSKYL